MLIIVFDEGLGSNLEKCFGLNSADAWKAIQHLFLNPLFEYFLLSSSSAYKRKGYCNYNQHSDGDSCKLVPLASQQASTRSS